MLVVIVIYLNNWRAILRSAGVLDASARPISSSLSLSHILIYDNSPQAQVFTGQDRCTYFHDSCNGGTRAAYIYAHELALKMGFEWMQFLDQDTEVPAAYWAWLESLTAAELENISVIVPMVQSNGVVVSPNRMDSLGRLRPASASCQVKIPIGSWVSAIASGMVIRVRSFGALGSIPEVFWLDSLDHWMFIRFADLRLRVLRSPIYFSHDLAFSSPEKMPISRLLNIIKSEGALVSYLPLAAKLYWPLRLIKYLSHLFVAMMMSVLTSCGFRLPRAYEKPRR